MCNLSGFIGKANETTEYKTKILGLLGRTRGTDATGIVVDGELTKKAGRYDSDSVDFFQQYAYPEYTKDTNVILTHNRAGSFGYSKTEETAQPFNYNDQMFFMHNGTITNADQIAKKYGLNAKEYASDSHIFGQLIYQGVDLTKLFTEYEGTAVFIWWWSDEEVIHVFKGCSEQKLNNLLEEERPLSIVKEKEGYYFSSLSMQLSVISNEDIKNIPLNKIVEIDPSLEFNNFNFTIVDRKVKKEVINNNFIVGNKYKNKSSYNFNTNLTFEEQVNNAPHVCTFYKNRYYMGKIPMHGIFKLNSRGMFCDYSPIYYFHHGLLLNSQETYYLAKFGKEIMMSDLHPRCLSRSNSDKYYWYNNEVTTKQITNAIFNLKDYNFINGSLNSSIQRRSFPSFQDVYGVYDLEETLENFNAIYDCNAKSYEEIRNYYVNVNNINSVDLAGAHFKDFQGICSGITQLVNNEYTDLYNDMMKENFCTLFQCYEHWFDMMNLEDPSYNDYTELYTILDKQLEDASINL